MREIRRAENSGFCFGVKRALMKTEEQIDKKENRTIYTCGPLIHNRFVTDDLARRGVRILENLEEVKEGDTVIVRSDTGRVLKLAAMLYLMPLVLFFLGYFLVPGGSGLRMGAGGAAFAVGISICVFVSRNMKKNDREMHFSIVRVLDE